ncbi:PaaX family transcriptional regulator C-terminal domain-containing protein [Streptomyces sp. NPDC005438]|uniref:PaaX family transcriptional regulator n=1 Tax=Streptomyces sp. NPDC005438 TaxID=3156880 RepID=UPI0033B95693
MSSARPSPGSLILTCYGAWGRDFPDQGTVPVATLIRLLAPLGVDAPSVRSAVSRLKRRGLLTAHGSGTRGAGYRPSPAARELLEDGDRRIFHRPDPDDRWLLVVFSVPESQRSQRHQLRSRLARLGFGTAAPGVWIAPAHLESETRHALDRLDLTPYVDLFTGEHSGFQATPEAVARWWDLEDLAGRHRAFLATQEPVLERWSRDSPEGPDDPEEAYRDYLLALDAWRRLPYADPGLPRRTLPEDWPGQRSAEVFDRLRQRLWRPGRSHVRRVAGLPRAE